MQIIIDLLDKKSIEAGLAIILQRMDKKEEVIAPSLSESVRALELSTRVVNVLLYGGITTIDELCQESAVSLCKLTNFGHKCLREVELVLSKEGLELYDGS